MPKVFSSKDLGFDEPEEPVYSSQDLGFDKDETTPEEAFHKNASDTALLGYGPQVRAGVIDPLIEKVGNLFTGNDVDMGDYVENRDAYRKEIETAKKEHPVASGAGALTGAAATSMVPGLNIAKGATGGARILNAAKTGAIMSGLANPGDIEGEISGPQLPQRIENAAMGMGTGALLQGAGEGVAKSITKGKDFFKKSAEKMAENSTGATGAQSAKFRDGAGRELLDRKLVRFGDNAEKIAERVGGAVDEASAGIDSVLKELDAKGVTASADNVVAELQSKVAALKKDPSQAGTVRKMQAIIDDIIETGESSVPISQAEQTKRGFRKAAGNWMDPEAGRAGKQAYLSYMDEVENAARKADPTLAKKFEDSKNTFGLLSPIQEAAEKRANTLNQSPIGGLLDVATAGGAGATVGGPVGMVTGAGAALGRRMVSPRIASSAAVSLDKIAQTLMKSQKFADMAQRNPKAFSTMVQSLANNPKFQERPGAPRPTPLLERMSADPSKMDVLKNDKLKEQLKKNQEQRKIKEQVPIEEAQASYVQGN